MVYITTEDALDIREIFVNKKLLSKTHFFGFWPPLNQNIYFLILPICPQFSYMLSPTFFEPTYI